MRFSTVRPPLTGFSAMFAWITILCTVLHVWNVQALSRDMLFPSPRTSLVSISGSGSVVTSTPRRLRAYGHDLDLEGSLAGFKSRRKRSMTRISTMLHAAPSKKTSAPSVPPTNTTSQNTNNPATVAAGSGSGSAATSKSRSNLLQELRSRHKTGEKLTQEYCDGVVAWCVAQDEWDSVLDVLDIMKSQGLYQVRSTYTACLRSCLDVPNAASAKEILSAMEQAGIPPGAQDIAVTVAAMCRQEKTEKGWWKKALQLVLVPPTSTESIDNTTEQLPVQSYDAVLSCMSDDRQWQEAARLLRRMEQGLAPPAVSTYRLVIECCVKSQQAEQALQVLQSCVKRGLVPTVYSFEIVISALSKKLQWRQAVQLLDVMDDLKIPKTLLVYNTLLSACSKAREVVQAKNLLVQMRKSGIQPNVMSYNSVMSACASTSRWKDALAVLDQCHRTPGVTPDVYTYTIAMRACAKGGQTRQALALLQVVKDKGLAIDTYCYTAAIEACSKAKMWRKALELLNEMEEKGVAPSEVTYSITITACGNGGQWSKALELLDIMRKKGLSINLITYNSAITAMSKAAKQSSRGDHGGGELWTRVVELLSQMKADGIEPDGFSYSSAISCCGAEGRWEEALELMEVMQKGGLRTRPNKIAYTAAISSCGRAGKVEDAVRLFRQMKIEGLSADRVAYNALFSALRVAKKCDMAYELWGEMCGRPEIVKTTAIAKPDRFTTPDVITVTEAIAAISAGDNKKDRDRVDEVFKEAVKRGIILRKDTLDSQGEFDLSGLSFPVARAACRFIVKHMLENAGGKDALVVLTFITGVGTKANRRQSQGQPETSEDSFHMTSLREYVQEILLSDFDPPITSFVPERAQGTVQIRGRTLEPHFK